MKNIFRVLVVFAAVLAVVTPWTGCGGNAGKDKVKVEDSGYPPAPEAIRTANIELLDGSKFTLEEKKGKVILINLWATWCGPCRHEMPELVKLQDKYRDQGLEIIGLDVDPEPAEDIKAFSEKMGLNYQLGWSERELTSAIFDLSGTDGIPQSFLVNRNGELTGVFFGVSESVIEKLKTTVANVMEGKAG